MCFFITFSSAPVFCFAQIIVFQDMLYKGSITDVNIRACKFDTFCITKRKINLNVAVGPLKNSFISYGSPKQTGIKIRFVEFDWYT